MYADLQAQIGFWGGKQEQRDVGGSRSPLKLLYPSFGMNPCYLAACALRFDARSNRGVPLTSVHQPLSHGLGHIEGDPLRSSLGQDILAPDVALLGFGVVFLEDLRGKMKM